MLLIRTRVAPSRIHGLGVFVVEAVPAGTPIWRFEPGFDRELAPEVVRALPPPAREFVEWYGYRRPADGVWILSGDHACFMNHAHPPNTGTPPDRPGASWTVALRDLEAGEELTCDYFAFDAEAARKLNPSKTEPGPG